jgi:hypothetical protein
VSITLPRPGQNGLVAMDKSFGLSYPPMPGGHDKNLFFFFAAADEDKKA